MNIPAEYAGAGLAVVVMLLIWGLYRLVKCPTNKLEWEDLVATNGSFNAYKIGYWVGVILGAWVVTKQALLGKLDADTFLYYLLFLGGTNVLLRAVRHLGESMEGRGYRDYGGYGSMGRAVDDPDEPLQGEGRRTPDFQGRDDSPRREAGKRNEGRKQGSRGENR